MRLTLTIASGNQSFSEIEAVVEVDKRPYSTVDIEGMQVHGSLN